MSEHYDAVWQFNVLAASTPEQYDKKKKGSVQKRRYGLE